MKFEYKRVEYMDGNKFIQTLQSLGAEGWELVCVVSSLENTDPYAAYLKRQVQE